MYLVNEHFELDIYKILRPNYSQLSGKHILAKKLLISLTKKNIGNILSKVSLDTHKGHEFPSSRSV